MHAHDKYFDSRIKHAVRYKSKLNRPPPTVAEEPGGAAGTSFVDTGYGNHLTMTIQVVRFQQFRRAGHRPLRRVVIATLTELNGGRISFIQD